jgi:site-specific DNA-methyltransferase (cytosine-N4-specific)
VNSENEHKKMLKELLKEIESHGLTLRELEQFSRKPAKTPEMSKPQLAFTTPFGKAFQGDSRALCTSRSIRPKSVDLIMTSPPFALTRKKDYGNEPEDRYVEWFLTFVEPFKRVLKETGSIVIDIGGSYLPGRAHRSAYQFKLAVALAEEFDLCQEFYWYNPAKLPSPAEWVNVRRLRVKDSCNLVLWLSNDAMNTKADNRRVLKKYSASMEALLKSGFQTRKRPSGHDISKNFMKRNAGSIPPNLLGSSLDDDLTQLDGEVWESLFPNLLAISNTGSNMKYQRMCAERKIKPHPARFPVGLPAFFIEFLTEPGDLVFDPFGGSGVTGEAAELLSRRWITCDLDQEAGRKDTYVRASSFRFDAVTMQPGFDTVQLGDYEVASKKVLPLPTRNVEVVGNFDSIEDVG